MAVPLGRPGNQSDQQARGSGAVINRVAKYIYPWPPPNAFSKPVWQDYLDGEYRQREMPESAEEVAADSRWPAFFSQPICLITTTDGQQFYLEREVGPCIVNRFPYVMTISLCRKALSERHTPRVQFMEALEKSGIANVQFLPLGPPLDRCLDILNTYPEGQVQKRVAATGLPHRRALSNAAPVFADAFMVYETHFCRPMEDLYGNKIYEKPYVDVGSHRVYFLEVNCIQLRQDIADGRTQIAWNSLAEWTPRRPTVPSADVDQSTITRMGYIKPFTPYYKFPASNTVAFEYEGNADGMAYKHFEAFQRSHVEVIDNDKTRWPCFFPSSLGMITSRSAAGKPNLMPCGSTTVISRSPLVISPAVTYGGINDRYRSRYTLHNIRAHSRFGVGLATVNEEMLAAIRYAGNVSAADDPNKLRNTGLSFEDGDYSPILRGCPIHFDCEVVGEVKLGTHSMFLGEVQRILVRTDVSAENPITWNPWPVVLTDDAADRGTSSRPEATDGSRPRRVVAAGE
ncbi:MAG TPA: flavin reductase family protein [Pseudolabrys sp.]|nr:flavin reductase family protein [Pseudolabrys sp.]